MTAPYKTEPDGVLTTEELEYIFASVESIATSVIDYMLASAQAQYRVDQALRRAIIIKGLLKERRSMTDNERNLYELADRYTAIILENVHHGFPTIHDILLRFARELEGRKYEHERKASQD